MDESAVQLRQRDQKLRELDAHHQRQLQQLQHDHHDALALLSHKHSGETGALHTAITELEEQLKDARLMNERTKLQIDVDIEHALQQQHRPLRERIALLEGQVHGASIIWIQL